MENTLDNQTNKTRNFSIIFGFLPTLVALIYLIIVAIDLGVVAIIRGRGWILFILDALLYLTSIVSPIIYTLSMYKLFKEKNYTKRFILLIFVPFSYGPILIIFLMWLYKTII